VTRKSRRSKSAARAEGRTASGMQNVIHIYMEETIASLPRTLINAGSPGLLAEMSLSELIRELHTVPVNSGVGSGCSP
jgi:hypothetical protein